MARRIRAHSSGDYGSRTNLALGRTIIPSCSSLFPFVVSHLRWHSALVPQLAFLLPHRHIRLEVREVIAEIDELIGVNEGALVAFAIIAVVADVAVLWFRGLAGAGLARYHRGDLNMEATYRYFGGEVEVPPAKTKPSHVLCGVANENELEGSRA